MVVNGGSLLVAKPIKNMLSTKEKHNGVSHGLSEVGYDIRLKQEIRFMKPQNSDWLVQNIWYENEKKFSSFKEGRFTIASAIEEFDMPINLMGIVHDKSTWARRGLSVFNTVIEPGWKGFLTLELVFNGNEPLTIPAGTGIAQVVFHEIKNNAQYLGKYQNQADQPVSAILER